MIFRLLSIKLICFLSRILLRQHIISWSEFRIGDMVYDDLTRTEVKIIGISYQNGEQGPGTGNCMNCLGYWVNNDWVGGGRHPWEIWKLNKDRLAYIEKCKSDKKF